jgi:predicted transcriptional regulator of viral defense system
MNIRIKQLANSGQILFRDIDLAVLWHISNKNTLYTTIKRYTKSGSVERISPGIYSVIDSNKISKDVVGAKLLHRYCYVSTETILKNEGIILQSLPYTTFVSDISKKFSVKDLHFASRKLKDVYLYNTEGIYSKDGVNYATKDRAVADILYFNPFYHFDNTKKIDWKRVGEIQKLLGYKK